MLLMSVSVNKAPAISESTAALLSVCRSYSKLECAKQLYACVDIEQYMYRALSVLIIFLGRFRSAIRTSLLPQ